MRSKLFLFTFLLLSAATVLAATPVEEGKNIFSSRCASCHNVNKVLTGPALAGVHERRSMDWIISFVKSSQTLVKSGDEAAVELFNKFNKIPMPDHPDLTDANITSIVEYIKSEGSTATTTAPFARPSKLRPAYTPLSISNYGFFIGYLAVVGLLIMTLLLAVQLKQYERKTRGEV
jgi:mono/diheme cytochrome c family protein